MFPRIVFAASALVLASCVIPRHPLFIPRSATGVAGSASLPPAARYAIDSSGSELRLLVYRAGPLAALGHNHVIVSRLVTGTVQVGASVAESSFSFSVPAESFAVDESQARREEGEDFPGDISADAKLGTRRNMLGSGLLDAQHYPTITVTSTALSGTARDLVAELTIQVAGHETTLSAPFHLQGDTHRMIATGTMELRQSALGLTPQSLMHGALQVQDAVQLKFSLVVPIS